MKKNNTILIVGESGSGKTTLCNALAQYGLKTLQSYTTRKPRFQGETGHIFISKEQYDNLPDKVASTYFDGNYYCATSKQVESCDLYVIDLEGIKTLKENYKGTAHLVVVGLRVPEQIRYERMLERGDSSEMAETRIEHDRTAFANMCQRCDVILDASKPVEELATRIMSFI